MASKKTSTTVQAVKAKAPAKKRTQKSSKRVLAHAEGAQCFWVHDGRILSNLLEFSEALKNMERGTFEHHVHNDHNDFADWIEFVLGDTELASEIRPLMKSAQTKTVVIRRLKIYDLP